MKTVLSFLLCSALNVFSQPAQVILLRHAEKPDARAAVHLSARGEERARALVCLFATNSTLTSNTPIAALYATRPTKHDHSLRTGETLAPLSRELGLPVQAPYESERYSLLARDILTNGRYRGKTVVICWTHHDISDLASALGVKPKPPPWREKTFDRLWLVKPGARNTEFQDLPQGLLNGDPKQ